MNKVTTTTHTKRELVPMTQAIPPSEEPPLKTEPPQQQLMLTEENIAELAAAGWTKEDDADTPTATAPPTTIASQSPSAEASDTQGGIARQRTGRGTPQKTAQVTLSLSISSHSNVCKLELNCL